MINDSDPFDFGVHLMETSYIITFIGDDRPGLVEKIANVIEANHGNWHNSLIMFKFK